jgi:multidrug resistance efflux pump
MSTRPDSENASTDDRINSAANPESEKVTEQAAEHSTDNATDHTTEDKAEDRNVNRAILIVASFILVLLVWQVVSDRVTPLSSDVRVRGFVVPVSAQVSGQITSVGVMNNQLVQQGDVLFEVDREKYELAVVQARAELDKAGQSIGADVAAVASARARLSNAESVLAYAKAQSQRLFGLVEKGVMSRSEGDKVETQLQRAKGNVKDARGILNEAIQTLGDEGKDNPRIRAAASELSTALLDLKRSKVTAPSDGGVTNLSIDIGRYAKVGAPQMTFVSTGFVWVEAYMRENSIGNIKPGDAVEIALDVAPGDVFKGTVVSTGFGISWGETSNPGELPQIKATKSWLRDPQRFPVLIKFDEKMPVGTRRVGGQADIIVYTGDNLIMNALGWSVIRFMSLISYLH